MQVLKEEPHWGKHPQTIPSVYPLPTTMWGLPLEWESEPVVIPIFMEQFQVTGRGLDNPRDIFLFGVRFSLAGSKINGKRYNDGHFMDFLILEFTGIEEYQNHRLSQHATTTWDSMIEREEFVSASKVLPVSAYVIRNKPHWVQKGNVWPSRLGLPMTFVGQTRLEKTPLTESLLTWNRENFLFWDWNTSDGKSVFKMVVQVIGEQSLESHYKDEDRRFNSRMRAKTRRQK